MVGKVKEDVFREGVSFPKRLLLNKKISLRRRLAQEMNVSQRRFLLKVKEIFCAETISWGKRLDSLWARTVLSY
jgi:hypothetical protein